MIAVWSDGNAVFLGGSGQAYPLRSLTAVLNADSTLEIWTAGGTSRVAGPASYTIFTDGLGAAFASAALAKAYLDAQFAKKQSSFQRVQFDGVAGGQTVPLGAVAGDFQLLSIQGLVQIDVDWSISGQNLVIPAGLVWAGAKCVFHFNT